jgi:hypothetical protein
MILLFLSAVCFSQKIDTTRYSVKVEVQVEINDFFTSDPLWRGADGASSIDMGNGKVLWLFSDGFVCKDSTRSRKNSVMIRNSVAIQTGYDLKDSKIKYCWDQSGKKPKELFWVHGKGWFWTGHGTMVKDRLIIFLIKEHSVRTGLGFEASGWYAVVVYNPGDEPSKWKMKYFEGPETFGLIAGSGAVLKDDKYLYSYGAVEPATHEIYLLRWKLEDAYNGRIMFPEWFMKGKWAGRKTRFPVPDPLFTGGTEFSVHYDSTLKKYIQIQSFGFGEGELGFRLSDSLQGPWTNPFMFYKPVYPGVKKPFMYSAKAHPELHGNGIYITYNINSFDFGELIENQNIYFPKFVLLKVSEKTKY